MEKDKFIILLTTMIIAVFLGSFVASLVIFGGQGPMHRPPLYFMGGQMRPPSPIDINTAIEQNEKMAEQQEEFFDKMNDELEDAMEKAPRHGSFGFMSNAGLKIQETKDLYKIVIDLKPFNNDANNVNVKIKGNSVIITAKYKSKDKQDFSSSEVYQSLRLPSKIDINKVKQLKDGNSLVVIIPKQ